MVLDGNRRLAAIRVLEDPDLVADVMPPSSVSSTKSFVLRLSLLGDN